MDRDALTIKGICLQLNLAVLDLRIGDLLTARERLAVIVIGLDRVTYPSTTVAA